MILDCAGDTEAVGGLDCPFLVACVHLEGVGFEEDWGIVGAIHDLPAEDDADDELHSCSSSVCVRASKIRNWLNLTATPAIRASANSSVRMPSRTKLMKSCGMGMCRPVISTVASPLVGWPSR